MGIPKAGDAAHAAGLVHALLAALAGMRPALPLDPAHAERLDAAEEACRLVADAAGACPSSLRPAFLAGLAALLLRLAVEVDAPGADAAAFPDDAALRALEARHGSRAAALMALAMALDAMAPPGGRPSAPEPAGLLWLPRASVRAWALRVDSTLARLEEEVLLATGRTALARDGWTVACQVAVALAHVTDHACVDARAAFARLAGAGEALSQAVALHASRAVSGSADGPALAFLGMVPVVEEGFALLRGGLADRVRTGPAVAWRLVSGGRTGLAPGEVRALAGAAGGLGGDVEAAGLSYEEEWRAA